MSKKHFGERFLSTLQSLIYQWNITSKETLKTKTTYNKSFKLKLKVINLTSVLKKLMNIQLKKLAYNIYTLNIEKWHVDFSKTKTKE